MAILVNFYGPGMKKDHYEKLRKDVGWERTHPSGGILHVIGFDEKGDARVTDVWESQQALDAFVGTHLAPAMQRHGIQMPQVSIYPVHNFNTYSTIDKYKLK